MPEDTIRERAARVVAWFGPRLRELRAARGLTQASLAEMIGVHQSRIAGYESTTTTYAPSWDVVVRLAYALDVGTDVFTRPPREEGAEKKI